jgi:type III restriction enzyme
LNAAETATLAELAPFVEGKPDFAGISEIDLKDLANKFRMQRIIFETARDIYDHSYHPEHEQGSASYLEGNPI